METIYDHLTSMRLTGPITTFSPTSASAPVARTAKNFPEAPPATLGCTFEGEKVKVMVLGARSKEGQMWKNKQVKKLEEIIRETKN